MTLNEIGAYLQANGVGTVGTDIFLDRMPETPDTCIALFEYGGSPTHRTMNALPGTANAEVVRIQILCRAATHVTARSKARSIFALLDHYDGTLSSVTYYYVMAISSPFYLKRDENERAYYACNFEITKALS